MTTNASTATAIRRYAAWLTVLALAAAVWLPAWPAAADQAVGQLAFQTDQQGTCCRIATINTDGSGERVLMGMYGFDAAWSPDGATLAFAGIGKGGRFDVLRVRLGPQGQTYQLQNLTNAKSRDTSPAWFPDGNRLAFISDRTGAFNLYTMTASGTEQTNVLPESSNDCGCFSPWDVFAQPAVSPDGTKLAFTSDRATPGGALNIFLLDLTTGVVTALTSDTDPAAVNAEPDFSPDGGRIAWAHGTITQTGIWVMNADGSAKTPLTSGGANDTQPDYAPDGSQLAFTRGTPPGRQIWLMSATGNHQRQVTHDGADDERPDWRPAAP
jgi:TolB protein